jgi:hypothetical protein
MSRPGLVGLAQVAAQRLGLEQRVAAVALDPRDALVVDHHRGAGLQDRLEAVGLAVAEAVVGDPGVEPQPHRGQPAT